VTTVEVRSADRGDAAAIAAIRDAAARCAYADILPPERLSPVTPQEWAHRAAALVDDPDTVMLVAVESDEVIGFVCVSPSRDDDAYTAVGEIQMLYVATDRWRAGVGALLLKAAEERMRSRFEQATLWVLTANTAARRFYRRVGRTMSARRS